jgi:RHS repeat-associated protein
MNWRSKMLVLSRPLSATFFALGVLTCSEVHGFHFPWDQGHDTFKPAAPPPNPLPCKGKDCDPCKKAGSPVEFSTGAVTTTVVDFRIPSNGVTLEAVRTYRSDDSHNGLFGSKWVSNLSTRLVEVTDGITESIIIREPNGQRDIFRLSSGQTYELINGPAERFLIRDSVSDFTLIDLNGTSQHFSSGLLRRIEDASGNALSFDYDNTGFPIRVSDSRGRGLAITKGPNGKISQITDFGGRTVAYEYDGNAQLIAVTALTGRFEYRYDAAGNLLTIIQPTGQNLAEFTYDSTNRATSSITPAGSFTYLYDSATQVRRRDSLTANITTYTLDQNSGLIIRIADSRGTVSRSYDSTGLLTSATDRRGNTSTRVYDSSRRLQSFTDALGQTLSYSYNAKGDPTTIVEPNGLVTRFEYDPMGKVTAIIEAAGTALERVTRYAYNARGLLQAETDALGGITRFEYDDNGYLSRTIDPNGKFIAVVNDQFGNVISYTDETGNITSSTYDSRGNLLTSTDPLGGVTTFTYDFNGNLSSVSDANRHTTTYQFDSTGRQTVVVDPAGQRMTVSYNSSGDITSVVDFGGRTRTFQRDSFGRVLRVDYADGLRESFTYDGNDNVLSFSNGVASAIFRYDALDRVDRYTNQVLGKTIEYAYGSDRQKVHRPSGTGLVVSRSDGDGGTQEHTYDLLGRLLTIKSPDGNVFHYEYDALDRVTRRVLPPAIVSEYRYDVLGNVAQITHKKATGEIIESLTYSYDPAGNRLSETNFANQTVLFEYDALGRLQRESRPDGSQFFYAYDAEQNRTRVTINGQVQSYEYDVLDRLTRFIPATGDVATYAYDANGNLLIEQRSPTSISRYSYDSQNRVKTIDFPNGQTSTLNYEIGWKRSTIISSLGTRHFLYSGEDLVSEFNGNGVRLYSLINGDPNDSRVNDVLAQKNFSSNETIYFLEDVHQSPIAAVTSGGVVVARQAFSAFGERVQSTGDASQLRLGYTGSLPEENSPLLWMRHRQYDSRIGRFTTRDPAGQIDGPNLYSYVRNNPATFTDPLGLKVTYTGCNKAQRAKIDSALKDARNTVNSPPYKCFIGKSLGKRILSKTQNMEFRCGGGDCKKNKSLFGYTYRNANYLYLCDLAFSSSQNRMNAVVFHEISHTAGADENTAEGCENRCYEGRGATKPTKGESCDDCK